MSARETRDGEVRDLLASLAERAAVFVAMVRWDGEEREALCDAIEAADRFLASQAVLETVMAGGDAPAAAEPDEREVIYIARCPEHGLQGERMECFVCGGPVEQVRVTPVEPCEAIWESGHRAGIAFARSHPASAVPVGGHDPSVCSCPAGEAWSAGEEETGTRELLARAIATADGCGWAFDDFEGDDELLAKAEPNRGHYLALADAALAAASLPSGDGGRCEAIEQIACSLEAAAGVLSMPFDAGRLEAIVVDLMAQASALRTLPAAPPAGETRDEDLAERGARALYEHQLAVGVDPGTPEWAELPDGARALLVAEAEIVLWASGESAEPGEDVRLRDGLAAAYERLTAADPAGAQHVLEVVMAGGDVPTSTEPGEEVSADAER